MGIKNFQGNHIGKEPVAAEKITVRDFMTEDITTFKKGESILDVMETLVELGISGGPVVDSHNELIGIISEGDCIKQIAESRYYNQPMEATNVEDYMIKDVETVSPDMHLFDLANKFLTLKIRRFPVCHENKLIGLVSQKSVLKTALALHGHSW